MDQGKNDMKEYLEKRGKTNTKSQRNNKSGSIAKIRTKSLEFLNYVKKWGFRVAKATLFAFFVYRVESTFSKMRIHIARNGGLRKQGM